VKKYQIIYADPPWEFGTWGKSGKRAPQTHYACMPNDDIAELPIPILADANCTLFLWVTMPVLEQSFKLINHWNFKYSTVAFTWVKQNRNGAGLFFGLGYWTRANAELCLLATKGHPKRVNRDVPQIVMTPRMAHSRKPDEVVRDRIIRLCGDLPRIELFARRKVEGWDCWGNEIESDIVLPNGEGE